MISNWRVSMLTNLRMMMLFAKSYGSVLQNTWCMRTTISRRKGWIKANGMKLIQTLSSAMEFLQQSDLLKIEDILPFFPDFVLIDDFKEEICNALEEYNIHIEELKAEMDEATKSSESIRLDIRELKNRYDGFYRDKENMANMCMCMIDSRW